MDTFPTETVNHDKEANIYAWLNDLAASNELTMHSLYYAMQQVPQRGWQDHSCVGLQYIQYRPEYCVRIISDPDAFFRKFFGDRFLVTAMLTKYPVVLDMIPQEAREQFVYDAVMANTPFGDGWIKAVLAKGVSAELVAKTIVDRITAEIAGPEEFRSMLEFFLTEHRGFSVEPDGSLRSDCMAGVILQIVGGKGKLIRLIRQAMSALPSDGTGCIPFWWFDRALWMPKYYLEQLRMTFVERMPDPRYFPEHVQYNMSEASLPVRRRLSARLDPEYSPEAVARFIHETLKDVPASEQMGFCEEVMHVLEQIPGLILYRDARHVNESGRPWGLAPHRLPAWYMEYALRCLEADGYKPGTLKYHGLDRPQDRDPFVETGSVIYVMSSNQRRRPNDNEVVYRPSEGKLLGRREGKEVRSVIFSRAVASQSLP